MVSAHIVFLKLCFLKRISQEPGSTGHPLGSADQQAKVQLCHLDLRALMKPDLGPLPLASASVQTLPASPK
jgi:hypothetical protein